ncbi:MAG: VOC family protein [Elainellaceae cyanobacterium]
MATETRVAPKQYHTITPHLTVRNAEAAIEFYKKAFRAEELYRMPNPDGEGILHAELKIGDSHLFLNDEFPDMDGIAATTLGGTPVTIHLSVDDVDAWFEQAVRAGAAIAIPLEDMFWGDRYGKVVDPFGHHWSLSSPIGDRTAQDQAAQDSQTQASACA